VPNLRLTMKPLQLAVLAPLSLLAFAVSLPAQRATLNADSSRVTGAVEPGATPLVQPSRAGVAPRPACANSTTCVVPVPVQDRTVQRSRYALWGFVAGAAVGWMVFAQACESSDCYGPSGGILLASAGGLLGMVVGLLLAPAPR
jgi:hypothetical protein